MVLQLTVPRGTPLSGHRDPLHSYLVLQKFKRDTTFEVQHNV